MDQLRSQVRKVRKSGLCKRCANCAAEFTSQTSLHGLQYIGNRTLSCWERVLWLVVCVAAFMMCCIGIRDLFRKWTDDPVVYGFDTKPSDIEYSPMPALTICNNIGLDDAPIRVKTENGTRGLTDLEMEYVSVLTWNHVDRDRPPLFNNSFADQIRDVYFNDDNDNNVLVTAFKDYQKQIEDSLLDEEKFFDFMKLINPPVSSKINGSLFDISTREPLHPVITDLGLCGTFNMLPPSVMFHNHTAWHVESWMPITDYLGWNLENGYTSHSFLEYPYAPIGTGRENGIKTTLYRTNADNPDEVFNLQGSGLRIVLHNPAEFPLLYSYGFSIHTLYMTAIEVELRKSKTSSRLKRLSPEQRGCYFEGEYKLSHFKHYTQRNCELECRAKFALMYCKCVTFYMPRNKTTPICGEKGMECISLMIHSGLNRNILNELYNETTKSDCTCRPGCSELYYDVKLTSTKIPTRKLLDGSRLLAGIWTYYRDVTFISTERQEMYGFTDFLANCGGFLGLFLGFSVLSILEIVYWFTIRFWVKSKDYSVSTNKGDSEKGLDILSNKL